jgi:hypothetical protein
MSSIAFEEMQVHTLKVVCILVNAGTNYCVQNRNVNSAASWMQSMLEDL